MKLTLDKHILNQLAEVVNLDETSALTSKLVEMGLYRGKNIKVLFKAPLGDPIAVDVGGYVLSLRLDEAKLIEIKPVGSNG